VEKTKIRTARDVTFTNKDLIVTNSIHSFDEGLNVYIPQNGSIQLLEVSYLSRPSDKAREIIRKIYHYKYLPAGWDESGGDPPSEKTINDAIGFSEIADEYDLPFYFTAPGPNGEIVIEFKSLDKAAEVYFDEDGLSEMILYAGKEQVYAGVVQIKALVNHFC